MKNSVKKTLGSLAALGLALSLTTGCSAVSTLTHPAVAWVAKEPAAMPVVVRRADAAEVTAHEVDRLLATQAAASDVGWAASVGPDAVAAAREMRALREEPVYADSHARVVAAEVWAATLPEVPSVGGGQPSLLGAISPKVAAAYGQLRVASGATASARADLLSQVRDAACKVPQADQVALTPALVNLAQAASDAEVANHAARLAYAKAHLTIDSTLGDVVRRIAADVVQERTRVRPDLTNLDVSVSRTDAGHVAVVLRGIRTADLGTTAVTDITDDVTLRAQAWLKHVDALGEHLATTEAALALEQDVLREIRRGFNPNATVEMPAASRIPAATAAEVDAVAPAVRLPRHVASDPRSASFEGALAPAPHVQPVDVAGHEDAPQT